MKKTSLIVGCAGFIGANLTKYLIENNNFVIGLDNLSLGSIKNIESFLNQFNFNIVDATDVDALEKVFSKFKIDEVWHLAANSDISAGIEDPYIDFNNTFLTTFNILLLMKKYNVPKINFASSSAIYGDFGNQKIHENIGPLKPISNYGAMKLASEAQIFASTESFLMKANIFRFPNVIGAPSTHGVLYDFVNKLKKNPNKLEVLGNGSQQKPYLHVSDLLNAMIIVNEYKSKEKNIVINIGPDDDGVTVKWISEEVVRTISPNAVIRYGTENKGWVGDIPKFNYSNKLIKSMGWKPKYNSKEAISKSIKDIINQ